jgi:hypothetical protein
MMPDNKKSIANLPDEIEIETIKSINRLADAEDLNVQGTSLEMALYRAEIAYLCDPHLRSVDFFWQMTDGQIDLAEFQEHARARKWEVARFRVRQKAQSDLIRRLSNRIVSEQLAEAEDLQRLRGWFFDLLTPQEVIDENGKTAMRFQVQPNSLEGAVRAYKDITVLLNMYRNEVLATLEPMAPDSRDISVAEDAGPFSRDEAGEIARALLDKRRRARHQLTDGKDSGDID